MPARGIEQGFQPAVPEARQSQPGSVRQETGRFKHSLTAPVRRGEPPTHRTSSAESNVFGGYAKGQKYDKQGDEAAEAVGKLTEGWTDFAPKSGTLLPITRKVCHFLPKGLPPG